MVYLVQGCFYLGQETTVLRELVADLVVVERLSDEVVTGEAVEALD